MGRVGGVHGLRGWVRINSYTEPRPELLEYTEFHGVSPQLGIRTLRLAEGRLQGNRVLARFEGVDDRDAAALLLDTELYIERSQLPVLGDGEYYWAELIGLEVLNCDGVVLGKITDLLPTGANDVIVVKGDEERLIPYVMGVVVQQIELDQGRMVVDWELDY